MDLEFRESFLRDVKQTREKGVKKKIAAMIAETKAASSLSVIRNVKKWRAARIIIASALGIIESASNCRTKL